MLTPGNVAIRLIVRSRSAANASACSRLVTHSHAREGRDGALWR